MQHLDINVTSEFILFHTMYTVKQLSTLAGVTPRTLHHYDQIDLLKPESVGENGYRYYGETSLLRLQQILFYRELGFSLESVRDMLGRPEFQVLDALEEHRAVPAGAGASSGTSHPNCGQYHLSFERRKYYEPQRTLRRL